MTEVRSTLLREAACVLPFYADDQSALAQWVQWFYGVDVGDIGQHTPLLFDQQDKQSVLADLRADANALGRAFAAPGAHRFRRLWAGDWRGYRSQSEADLALCQDLCFWRGRDPAAIDRLFRMSRLFRPKWDDRRGGTTYGARTVAFAIRTAHSVHPEART